MTPTELRKEIQTVLNNEMVDFINRNSLKVYVSVTAFTNNTNDMPHVGHVTYGQLFTQEQIDDETFCLTVPKQVKDSFSDFLNGQLKVKHEGHIHNPHTCLSLRKWPIVEFNETSGGLVCNARLVTY